MTDTTIQIAPPQRSAILTAAEAALRRVPPAFPLEATVAVNPFLGQTDEDLASAAARLGRVGGVRILRDRADYAARIAAGEITDSDLADALEACAAADRPERLAALKAALDAPSVTPEALPCVADLAAEVTGTDWPAILARSVGLWAAGHFDRGQALWTPAPGRDAFAAWREWATHDLTPELAGLDGFAAHVAACPDTSERAILRAAGTLGLSGEAAEALFHRLLLDLGGWAQHARWLLWQAELAGDTDASLMDLLAIRLVWEEALFEHCGDRISGRWNEVLAACAEPMAPGRELVIDAILQEAAERAYQRWLADALPGVDAQADAPRPALQGAFCIDVRSEVFRRALESVDGGIETVGFAGFFGLPVSHAPQASDVEEAHLPVLLTPGLHTTSQGDPASETALRIGARARRAWGRFRQAAVSSFAFVEAAGPLYAGKLVRDALGLAAPARRESPPSRFREALTPAQKAETAAAVLGAMSMRQGHARLVLLLGHGANVTNNPHESAYHCGACGGHTGEVSARLLARLLNDPETRQGLPAHGIDLPADTVFLAGLHDTTTDAVTLYPDDPALTHRADLAQARSWLDQAAALARAERRARLPRGASRTVEARASDWAELRPEWGLAGCAAFICAPRAATAGEDLGGRTFLHSYDWRADRDFSVLELILTAPVVVASWISLQYYGSATAPALFGSGNKLIHNVVGGIGVVQGNGGKLRAGLPWQSVHDGERLMHDPLRLTVMVEAPTEAITGILSRHDGVRALFDNGWLHLLALESGRVSARYRPGLRWEPVAGPQRRAA
ncbi:hypothetical protein SAMN05444007_103315 [Cribrihabitans marinus]|uniref:Probable inorganic carbon transporter subunit DabA n=1 Tax=Cribrihabitans marinus TaxID=1227549 RepID=A0A1H6VYG8_9RHOB|nr:DUF2309 domain-containing protein [Cribrihabitans marinus]GGH24972.1 UPF0753 protein [Cribrihabitans marinus]SEJ09653.1 hypothetical protein SAMN05444007_103315 [Cribrihabitans marinus]